MKNNLKKEGFVFGTHFGGGGGAGVGKQLHFAAAGI